MTLIRTIVILVSIAGALAVGIAGALWGGPRVSGVLILGTVPVLWGALHLVERRIGRDIWQFDAPYPYQSMPENIDQQVDHSRQTNQGKPAEAAVLNGSERPLAA